MNKIKIIALFGKSGAGKDTIQKWVVSNNPNIHEIISCTTRPPRDYEKNGVDYHFLTCTDFFKKTIDLSMLEQTAFKGWLYGTSIEDLDENKINIGVFNILGIERLLEDNRLEVLPILIDVPDKIRLLRNLNREENPDCSEICRRFLADEKDFLNISFEYRTFYNISDYSPAMFEDFEPIKNFIKDNNN
jgi:guanylate kinase